MKQTGSRKRCVFVAAILSAALFISGCYSHRGRLYPDPLGLFITAVVTAAIVSSIAPPPPREIVVPPPRPGYSWQPGFWTRDNDSWVWVEGRWVALPPHYQYAPAHWEQAPDGTWQLIPGRWVPVAP